MTIKPSETDYRDIEFLKLVVAAGEKFREAQKAITGDGNGCHDNNMWLGETPVMYLGDCVGFFRTEDEWVNFHAVDKTE